MIRTRIARASGLGFPSLNSDSRVGMAQWQSDHLPRSFWIAHAQPPTKRVERTGAWGFCLVFGISLLGDHTSLGTGIRYSSHSCCRISTPTAPPFSRLGNMVTHGFSSAAHFCVHRSQTVNLVSHPLLVGGKLGDLGLKGFDFMQAFLQCVPQVGRIPERGWLAQFGYSFLGHKSSPCAGTCSGLYATEREPVQDHPNSQRWDALSGPCLRASTPLRGAQIRPHGENRFMAAPLESAGQ